MGGRAATTTTTQDHGLLGQVPSPHAPRSNISLSGVPLTPMMTHLQGFDSGRSPRTGPGPSEPCFWQPGAVAVFCLVVRVGLADGVGVAAIVPVVEGLRNECRSSLVAVS